MSTKLDEFEESTKIKSSHEINEMLRNAAARPEPIFENEDSGGFGDVHTQVGNIQDLIAKSKEADPPPPVVARSSTHVIRRASSPVVIERPALGSQSDVPPPSDDDAFAEYDAPQAAPIEFDALDSAANVEAEATSKGRLAMIDEPMVLSTPVGRPLPLPAPAPSMPMPVIRVEQKQPTQLRWGAIAWVALLVITMATATLSYLKISELQQDLADARAQLKKR